MQLKKINLFKYQIVTIHKRKTYNTKLMLCLHCQLPLCSEAGLKDVWQPHGDWYCLFGGTNSHRRGT